MNIPFVCPHCGGGLVVDCGGQVQAAAPTVPAAAANPIRINWTGSLQAAAAAAPAVPFVVTVFV